jgi:hypothetical protein
VTTFWEELQLLAAIANALTGGTLLPVLGLVVFGLVACGCVALVQARRERRARLAVQPADDPGWEGLWAALLAPDDVHDAPPEEKR